MIIFAGGSSGKQWPALLDLLEKVGFKPASFDKFTKTTPAPPRSRKPKKGKKTNTIGSIYYSKSQAPSSVFSDPLKENKDANAIIFYESAELFIAEAMSASLSPDEAIFTWKSNIQEILSLFQQNRKRVVLIESHEALSAPNAFLTLCVNKFRFNGGDAISKSYRPVYVGKIYRLLAREILKNSPELQSLQDELYASSTQLIKSRKPDPIDIDELANEQKKLLSALEDETLNNKKLNANVASINQEIIELKDTILNLEGSISLSHEHLVSTQSQSEEVFIELQSAKHKIKTYEEKMIWREAKKAREVTSLESDIKKHSEAIKAMKLSRSWRITSPMRQLGRKVTTFKNRDPNFKKNVRIIKSSPLFDAKWYKEKYPDISNRKIDLAEHYIKYGASEGRSPGPNFNARDYLSKNPDVQLSGENPLIHFLASKKDKSEIE